jgi:CHAD domain-containing protein
LRSTLGKRRYQRENAALRDAARPLTELRDAKVVLNALLDLQSGEAAQLDAELLDQLTECLRQRRAELIDPAMLTHPAAVVADSSADANANADSGGQDVDPCGSGSGEAMERGAPAADDVAPPADLLLPAAQILKAALRRSKRWPRDGHGWRSIAKGIRRVYGAGRETMEVARRNPSVDHLHEWRKQAKYLRSQLEAVEPILPKVLCGLIEQARLIGDHLGDNHDLALLAQIVGGEFSTARDAGTLLTMIDQRRDQLASRAMSIGLELYRLKPDAFVARLRKPWHAWRHA